MTRIKRWLVEQFLPAYAREALLEENDKLRRQLTQVTRELERQKAYTDGLLTALRQQRHISIRNEVQP